MAGDGVRGQAPLQFQAVVLAVACLGHNFVGNVGAQNANVVAGEVPEQLLEYDRGAVGLLPGGAGGAPDADGRPQAAAACAGR